MPLLLITEIFQKLRLVILQVDRRLFRVVETCASFSRWLWCSPALKYALLFKCFVSLLPITYKFSSVKLTKMLLKRLSSSSLSGMGSEGAFLSSNVNKLFSCWHEPFWSTTTDMHFDFRLFFDLLLNIVRWVCCQGQSLWPT